MLNREELRQKGHDGGRKNDVPQEERKYHFQKGRGKIFFSDRNIEPWD
jgi:hypothetical protein